MTEHWVASWAAPMFAAHQGQEWQGEDGRVPTVPPRTPVDFALPGGRAADQTFRAIVRPQLWRSRMRVRFTNVFGDREIVFARVTVAIRESSAQLLPGTVSPVTFGGEASVAIAPGGFIESDPFEIPVVPATSPASLRGRDLAVSYAVAGTTGRLSHKHASYMSYLSAPGSGDLTGHEGEMGFRYSVPGHFLLTGLDVLAEPEAFAVVALGESVTDAAAASDGDDTWPEVLGRRLREQLGDRVAVINAGIGGNTVVTELPGRPEPVEARLERDVIGIPGATTVIWMQGHNDLTWGEGADVLMAGYRRVIDRLRAAGLRVVGGTLTSALWPGGDFTRSPLGPEIARKHGTRELDAERRRVNAFIESPGLFDAVIDLGASVEDPDGGSLREDTHTGDWLHPGRAGHLDLAAAVDPTVLLGN
jgi:lysophospholipase L1-like esterase